MQNLPEAQQFLWLVDLVNAGVSSLQTQPQCQKLSNLGILAFRIFNITVLWYWLRNEAPRRKIRC